MQKIAKSDRRIGTDRQTDKVRYREAPPLKIKKMVNSAEENTQFVTDNNSKV